MTAIAPPAIPVSGEVAKPAWKSGKGISEAKRNAEALFENKTVSDIREIEARTRKDIESKKLQLRQLVGDSYRDLMESADEIMAIANDCGTVMQNIKFIQGGFASLAHSFTSADNMLNEKRDSLTKHEELYAVGSRIKYMIDTPEMIWGFLDSKQYLEAACRYMRAQHVHDLLPKSSARDMIAKFPLLAHQWPLVEKFRKQIIDAVHQHLIQDLDLSTANVACALAAACYLKEFESQTALMLLLSSRRAWIKQSLAAATSACRDQEGGLGVRMDVAAEASVGLSLSEIANAVQLTIAQVGELFLLSGNRSGVDASCMLQLAVKEDDMDRSELMFAASSAGAAQAAGQVLAPEAEAWKGTNQSVMAQLQPLTSGQVEKFCTQWVKEVSEDLADACVVLLEQGCPTADSLVEVEQVIRTAIASWHHPSASASSPKAVARTSSIGGAGPRGPPSTLSMPASFSSSAGAGSGSLSQLRLDPALSTWDTASEWVLGAPMSLWNASFHTPFVRRAKDLISCAFSVVAQTVLTPLSECLAAAGASPAEPAGEVRIGRWPFAGTEAVALIVGEELAGMSPKGSRIPSMLQAWPAETPGGRVSSGMVAANDTASFRQLIQSIRSHFDQELRAVLRSVVTLLSSSEAGDSQHKHRAVSMSNPNLDASGGQAPQGGAEEGLGRMFASRANDLEPYVHQCCTELTASIAAELAAKLGMVGTPATGTQGSPAAEQVLLIGRLCSALAVDSRMLSVVLGPPEAWRQHVGAGMNGPMMPTYRHGGRAVAGRTPAICSRLTIAVERFRATSVASYILWSKWAAASLAQQLRLAMAHEDLLAVVSTPPSWQETVIPSSSMASAGSAYDADGGLAEPMTDMRFSLPACASSPLMSFLEAACCELRRAGDHTAGTDALQALEWELAGAAMTAFSSLLQSDESGKLGFTLSEKGVLQLLFDVRLMRDVLAGGRPLSTLSKDGGDSSGSGTGKGPAGAVGSGAGGVGIHDPAVMASVSSRKRELSNLEAQLQERLDPIDWATYEPHLWSAVTRYYQRTSVLFGSLIQLQRAHPEAAGKASAASAAKTTDMNPLNMMPPVARFQYLPISAPLGSTHHTGSTAASNNASSLLVLSVGQSQASGNMRSVGADLASNFSFSDLGSSGAGAGSKASPRTGAAAALDSSSVGASGGAFGALQARLQAGSLSAFGTILGDKAAEMTAMASQRFDITDFSALGSGLLSTFTSKSSAMKK